MMAFITSTRIQALAVLAVALAYFVYLAAPDVTWINTDSDAGTYIWSTQNLGLSHPTSTPIYNTLGYVVTLGADSVREAAHRLSLFSAISSAITSLILYQITKRLLTPAIFMASGLVVSQSTIVETYALITLAMVSLYALKNRKWSYVAVGAFGLGIHHLVLLAIIPISIWRYRTLRIKTDPIMLLGLFSYFYYIVAIRPDAEWANAPWYKYFFSQNFLFGGLSIEDEGLYRILEFLPILIGGLGIAAIVLFKVRDKLLWVLISLPITYYITNLAPQTYVYMMPSFAFIAIAVSQIRLSDQLRTAVALSCFALIMFNVYAYDIGRALDPEPTSARHFLNQLEELPEGSVVYVNHRGWERVLSWNAENDIEILVSDADFGLKGLGYSDVTHISISTLPNRYWSELVPCPDFPSCYNRWDGVDRVGYIGADN